MILLLACVATDSGVRSTFYADWDGDGHGDPWSDRVGSASGFVANADDCDDTHADVFPGAPETCNQRDDDCDGVSDDDPTDAAAWWTDADHDGYGDPASETIACAGDVAPGEPDCDDADAELHPGATERCDGIDQDCDGELDEGAPGMTLWLDVDGDGFGDPDEEIVACGGGVAPGEPDCDDGDATVFPGAAEACDGVDSNCDGDDECVLTSLAEARARRTGAPGSYVGMDVDAPGDVDGDGVGDLVAGGYYAGAVVEPGPVTGDQPFVAAAVADAIGVWHGGDFDGDGLADVVVVDAESTVHVYALGLDAATVDGGISGGAVPDVDGDGLPELAITQWVDPSGEQMAGLIARPAGPIVFTAANFAIWWGWDGNDAGDCIAAGDLDGDGLNEVLIGARGIGSGEFLVYLPPIEGGYSDEDADLVVSGEPYEEIGDRVLVAPDLDGDGRADLVIPRQADGAENQGEVDVFTGPWTADVALADAAVTLEGRSAEDLFGWSVAAGDTDGDGVAELAVAAQGWYETDERGAVFVFPWPGEGSYGAMDAPYAWEGETWRDGATTVSAGDVDADGIDDFLIGAWNAPDGSGDGAVYVVGAR